jgi:hypothetical protein
MLPEIHVVVLEAHANHTMKKVGREEPNEGNQAMILVPIHFRFELENHRCRG